MRVAPTAAPSTLFDLAGSFEVELARADMTLSDADDGRLDGGANLALIGDELIQFGRALPLGSARWRLGRLLRGRRGTEAAAGTQSAGDRFVLLENDSIVALDLPLATSGGGVRLLATGVGDTAGPVAADAAITGRSVVPPSPVHLVATEQEGGDLAIGWVRRSRSGWRWIDGVDAPLGEENEAYRVVVAPASGSARSAETTDPSITVTAAERAAGPVTVTVRQRGTLGESLPASITI